MSARSGRGCSKSGAKIDFLFEMTNLVFKNTFLSQIKALFIKKQIKTPPMNNFQVLVFPCNSSHFFISSASWVFHFS